MTSGPILTPDMLKAIMDSSRQDLESITTEIFESIELVVDANKQVAQLLDSRISMLEERLTKLEEVISERNKLPN